jgi:hypothetical protein
VPPSRSRQATSATEVLSGPPSAPTNRSQTTVRSAVERMATPGLWYDASLGREKASASSSPPGQKPMSDTLPAPSPKAMIRPRPSSDTIRPGPCVVPIRTAGGGAPLGGGKGCAARISTSGSACMHNPDVQRSPSRSRRSPARSPTGVSSPQLAPLEDDQTSIVPDGMSPFTGRSTEKRYRTSVSLENTPPTGVGSSRAISRPTNAPSTSGRRSRTSYVMQEHAEACGGDGRNRAAVVRTRRRRTRRTLI